MLKRLSSLQRRTMDTRQKIILIVDDEETLTWSMSKNLSLNKEYKIVSANSSEEALDVLEKIGEVDLVVSDIKMGEKDGLQLLAEIKARYPKTAFIVMTAYGSEENQREAFARGAIRYLEKPFMMDQIKAMISEALAEREKLAAGPEQQLDEQLKERIKNDSQLQQLLLEKSRQQPQLDSIQLLGVDGSCLIQVGRAGEGLEPDADFMLKAYRKLQQSSQAMAAGRLQELILSSDKCHILFLPLAGQPLMLCLGAQKSLPLGRVLFTGKQLSARIIANLGREVGCP